MANEVTDPAVLALLNGGDKKPTEVTDPAILAHLQDGAPLPPSILRSIREAIHSPTRILENGATLGLGDRLRAGMGAVIGDGSYGSNLKDEQGQTEQFKKDHPLAAPVIEGVSGAIAPVGVIGAAAKGAGLGLKTFYGAGAGAGIGGVQGFSGSKDWTDLPQTAKDTGIGVGAGAILGGAMPLVAKGVGAAYNGLASALTSTEGMSRGAASHLAKALEADGLPAVQSRVAELGPDAMLADAGPALLGKAQGASLNSDEGRSVLANALTARNEGTNARIAADVDSALGPARVPGGPPQDPQSVKNAIVEHRSNIDGINYPAALDNAPDVRVAHILTQIDDMIPRSVGNERRGLMNLREMMTREERQARMDPNTPGHQAIDARGNPIFDTVRVSQNDAEVLHKVKQELDRVINYDEPGLGLGAGALKGAQGTLKYMRGQVNDALERQVPGYAEANAASSALAKRADAVGEGTQYLGSGKTTPSPERFAAEFAHAPGRPEPRSIGEQIAFAKGSRGEIDRILGVKANDLQALRSELQGEGGWNTAKIATVHGQDAADQLVGTVDRNLKFRDTYNKVVENSQTAQRQAAARDMKPEPSSETPLINPNMSLSGLISTSAKKVGNAALNAMRPDPTRSFGEVARVLSAPGSQRDQHLAALADALSRRQGHAAMGEAVGGRAALAAALLGNGYVQSRPRQSQ